MLRRPLPVRAVLLAPLLLPLGCLPPVEAPSELDEVTAWTFARFDAGEPGALEAGVANIAAAVAALDEQQDARGVSLSPLSEEDALDLAHPGRDFGDLVSVGLAFDSAFAVRDHAELLLLADQTPVEPDSPERYDRHFVAPSDPSCFPGRDCEVLRTWNEVTKQSAVMTIPYAMGKDLRWVEMGESGSGEWALLGRSWIEDEAWDETGNAGMLAMFALELTWPTDGGSSRFFALWTESWVYGVGPDIIAPAALTTIENTCEAVEEYLAARSGDSR